MVAGKLEAEVAAVAKVKVEEAVEEVPLSKC
jgi:hypothetical protein